MTIAFVGHAKLSSSDGIKERIKEEMRKNIADGIQVSCYLGGYGAFDTICARACMELKAEYDGVEVLYVAPYLSLSEQRKIKEMRSFGLCDASIYPPIENTPPKFAILKRNEWMMANADLVIAFVNRGYGGAYQALQVAKRKKKKIINICDFLG